MKLSRLVLRESFSGSNEASDVVGIASQKGWSNFAKALALGASAVLVGRPVLHGLANAGATGVAQVLRLICDEFEIAMALTGCATPADIGPGLLRRHCAALDALAGKQRLSSGHDPCARRGAHPPGQRDAAVEAGGVRGGVIFRVALTSPGKRVVDSRRVHAALPAVSRISDHRVDEIRLRGGIGLAVLRVLGGQA